MARTYGKLLAAVWIDPDWCRLLRDEQWLFALLLSQPKLSLVGALDYRPARWAALSGDATLSAVEEALDGLEEARFVAVDRDTEEILIRSFTRHDGIPTGNPKLVKGLWGAWTEVASERLRKVAVDNMPEALFTDAAAQTAPALADRMRRSGRTDWVIDRGNRRAIQRAIDSPATETGAGNRLPDPLPNPQPVDTRLPDELREKGKTAVDAIRSQLPTHREVS